MDKKEKCCKGCVMVLMCIFVIYSLLWVLNDFKVFTWNIPWMPIAFLIFSLILIKKAKMHMYIHK